MAKTKTVAIDMQAILNTAKEAMVAEYKKAPQTEGTVILGNDTINDAVYTAMGTTRTHALAAHNAHYLIAAAGIAAAGEIGRELLLSNEDTQFDFEQHMLTEAVEGQDDPRVLVSHAATLFRGKKVTIANGVDENGEQQYLEKNYSGQIVGQTFGFRNPTATKALFVATAKEVSTAWEAAFFPATEAKEAAAA